MKQTNNNTNGQKLNLQKKTIKMLSTANMLQIQGGAKANNSSSPYTIPQNTR
jgi:hypothetical protein